MTLSTSTLNYIPPNDASGVSWWSFTICSAMNKVISPDMFAVLDPYPDAKFTNIQRKILTELVVRNKSIYRKALISERFGYF
jgi:hypothetical protein